MSSNDRSNNVVATVASEGDDEPVQVELAFDDVKVVGSGSFGVVCVTTVKQTGERIAIKKVLQDKRFKNRELGIMINLNHPNVVKLKYYFYSAGSRKDDIYLNLLLEFVPDTIYGVSRHFSKQKVPVPMFYIKLYMYQLFRGVAYIHSVGVTHRDIKPQNLLVDPESGVLKLCDFGSAKLLVEGEANISYICSRYYRAPELIFGASNYTNAVDMWSAGAVMAELVNGKPLFPGESGIDQLFQVMKVLGTPTKEQILSMNQNYTNFPFPEIRGQPWTKIFREQTPAEVIDLAKAIFEYAPTARLTAQNASAHKFFADLADPDAKMPNGRPLPRLEMNDDHYSS